MQDLTKLKDELYSRLAVLEARVQEYEKSLRAEHSSNFSEQATEREDEEVMERLEKDALDEIVQIKQALDRLDQGSYGTCMGCGEPIGEKRLEALPFATNCVECAE
ncbi:TraR/DksA family transcriptional regulator [Sneathiella limimaris]|uniref:TraR/DksA family transcriptional regulator n=1 Tax=Sneathiella limimaris TaxID=1964213 RepID=UPI00146B47CD|nr:TraR/DksA family transcriptional regulator [Sneathiella limimaris]